MRRRAVNLLAAAFLLGGTLAATAQDGQKPPRIAYVRAASPEGDVYAAAFRAGLRELGYIEGRSVAIEFRHVAVADLPSTMRQLVAAKVDMIVTGGTPAIKAALAATRTIPIVFGSAGDPVQTGLVASFAHPGGNATGLSILSIDLSGKRLELVAESVPNLGRIAILAHPDNPSHPMLIGESETAVRSLGREARVFWARTPTDIGAAFHDMSAWQAGAVYVLDDSTFTSNRVVVAQAALDNRLPTICGFKEMAFAGCTMSLGGDTADNYRRAAKFVDKILRGANPADLPVERPDRINLTINLKAAEALGLTIPGPILARADEIIE